MSFTGLLFSFFGARLREIDNYAHRTQEIQLKVLSDLTRKAKDTLWGISHEFEHGESYHHFVKHNPISSYEDLKPYIERMMQGEPNILWQGRVEWFAKSSGTTNDKSKFVPVSSDALTDNHYKVGGDVLALYSRINPNSQLFSGKSFILNGSYINKYDHHNIHVGDLSAILFQNTPRYIQIFKAPDREVALMSEWESKLQAIIETTRSMNITSLSGVPSWMLVMIKHMLSETSNQSLLEVWPSLEVFFHGGISFAPYREEYKRLIPSSQMHYVETYNASEGFFGIQNDLSDPSLLLMIDCGIFYEFIPLDELEKPNPIVLPLWEVEKGINYAMVITTDSGLWRYLIGDTVRFTSSSPYKFVITGRTKQFINAFGEELMVYNAEKALALVCEKHECSILNYTAAPYVDSANGTGCHDWMIEFSVAPSDYDGFARSLDLALQSLNSDYEAKRYKDITLQPLRMAVAVEGVFIEWMKSRGKLGGQHKVPRLSNSRDYIDPLMELNTRMR